MATLATNGLPMILEEEATGVVADLYEKVRRELQMPIVPNIFKAMAGAPNMLAFAVDLELSFYANLTIPQSLLAMIGYTIATMSDCTYCSVNNELTCRTLGVDEDTLEQLIKDLPNVNPRRIRAIIAFALKAASEPKNLTREDYDVLRDEGLTEAEIIEIVLVASVCTMFDHVADALQVDVESETVHALSMIK